MRASGGRIVVVVFIAEGTAALLWVAAPEDEQKSFPMQSSFLLEGVSCHASGAASARSWLARRRCCRRCCRGCRAPPLGNDNGHGDPAAAGSPSLLDESDDADDEDTSSSGSSEWGTSDEDECGSVGLLESDESHLDAGGRRVLSEPVHSAIVYD